LTFDIRAYYSHGKIKVSDDRSEDDMEKMVTVLEKKVLALLEIVKSLRLANGELSSEISTLRAQYDAFQSEMSDLRDSRSLLLEEKEQLSLRIDALEGSLLHGSSDIAELSQERELTRLALDSLIESIDSIVAAETQP
jgi:chromosome segregation ATPase